MIYILLCFDKIYLYSRDRAQKKYKDLIGKTRWCKQISDYHIVEASNYEIIPLKNEL